MNKKRFTINQSVRFRDIDALGHVNNAIYFTYMEEARKEFFMQIFNLSSAEGFPFILANISCNFNRPVRFEDKSVSVDIWVSKLGRKSFTFKYNIYSQTEPSLAFATAESVQVFYDYHSNKTIEIPTAFKEKVQIYLAP